MLFCYFTSVRIPLQWESKPIKLNSFFCIVKTIISMTTCKNVLLVKYIAVLLQNHECIYVESNISMCFIISMSILHFGVWLYNSQMVLVFEQQKTTEVSWFV